MDESNENEFLPPSDTLPSSSNDRDSSTMKISLDEEEKSNSCAVDPESFHLNLKSQPTPRPLAHLHISIIVSDSEGNNLLGILKSQILQERIRCDEELQQREKDRWF